MTTSREHRRIKARLVGFGLLDIAVDIVVPLVVSLVLTSAGVPAFLALTVSGIAVGAKSAMGRLESWRADRYAAFVAATAAVSLAVLVALASAGVPDVVAAGVAGAIGAVAVVVSLVGRRIDGFGLLVLAEIVATVAVTLISDDPRFVLARPAIYTAVAGGYALVTCVVGRPLMLDATKPVAAAGDPARALAFENAWVGNPTFRTVQRMTTLGLGAVLLAESVLRVLVVYSTDDPNIAVTGALAQAPAIALFAGWFLLVRFLAVPRARAAVDHEVALQRTTTAGQS
jgi:hypothetical protein